MMISKRKIVERVLGEFFPSADKRIFRKGSYNHEQRLRELGLKAVSPGKCEICQWYNAVSIWAGGRLYCTVCMDREKARQQGAA